METLSRRHFTKILSASMAASIIHNEMVHSANEKIKIGQIGTVHAHASGKISTIRKFSDIFELAGVVEPDEELRKEAEGKGAYRGVRWMSEEQLLNTPGLQVVAVETAVPELVPTAARCISAGVHIHLDKPAGESLSAFRELLDNASRKNLVIQMGYMFRYNPAFQFCFQAVREGWLGEIFELTGVIGKKVGEQQRRELSKFEGGTMFELGCHLIDALVTVMGKADSITAHVRKMHPEQDNLADNQLAVFEYPKATATIRSSLVEPFGTKRRQFVVCGTEGTVEIRPLEPPKMLLALSQPRGQYERGYQEMTLPPLSGRYDGDFMDLAKIVRGEKEPDYAPEHDLTVQESVLRASGMPV